MTVGKFIMSFYTDSDPHIVSILCAITKSNYSISDRWFEFGLALGLTVGDLHNIEMKYSGPSNYSREVILLWRSRNTSKPLEPIVNVLDKVGITDLAVYCKNLLSLQQPESSKLSSIYIKDTLSICQYSW